MPGAYCCVFFLWDVALQAGLSAIFLSTEQVWKEIRKNTVSNDSERLSDECTSLCQIIVHLLC